MSASFELGTPALALVLSLMTAGCSDPIVPAAPSLATPTVTESFSDTLLVRGSNTHQFTVQQVGGLKVSVDNVTPGAAVGLGVGTPSVGACAVLSNLTAVPGPAPQLSGTATVAGTFCVSVYDVGNLVEPVTYTVTVLHP
jgi:hypothetical protein